MLKNLFQIPNTFDPDDRRRRQVLNVLIIVLMIASIIGFLATVLMWQTSEGYNITETLIWRHSTNIFEDSDVTKILTSATIGIASAVILINTNRSSRVPGWFSGAIFLTLFSIALLQSDTPHELFSGRSLIYWDLPISISAIVIHPVSAFLVASAISGYLWIAVPHPGSSTPDFYAIFPLLFVAWVCWLGMSMDNRAIRDGRREGANNKAILENMGEGLLVLDLQGNFVSATPALFSMTPKEDLRETLSNPLGKTVQWKRKVFSVPAPEAPEVGTVAVFRDETRRHETERARDALLATASHELRTPLAATMNYLELLLMLTKLNKVNTTEFAEHLARAIENSKRLQRLVNDILDQAQIQAGVLELKPQSFNLRALLSKVHQLLDSLIQQKQLTYELAMAPEVPEEIVGDPERLHQVLVNLIGNAIKFTNQGKIKVNVATSKNDQLSIAVTDTGPGIPPEQLPDIFEAFRRGSNYAQRERQGAGLGLSIAKEIITRMGGEIAAASQFGAGSTFIVTLPIEGAYS